MAAINLSGRAIAITGASSGIGEALAIECAKAGMKVAIGARRVDRLNALAKRLSDHGGTVMVCEVDVRNAPACEAFIARAWEEIGPLYAVCANAGYGLEKPFSSLSDAELRDIYEVNFFGSVNVVRPAVERMLKLPWKPGDRVPRGHVLWVASCLSKMTIPFYGAYSGTKAAQAHLGRSMRLELAPLGVRVSTVHPISTRTEFFETAKDLSKAKALTNHAPAFFTQDACVVARRTVACLRRDRPEVWPGWKGGVVRLGMAINTLFPRLADFTTRGIVGRRTEGKC